MSSSGLSAEESAPSSGMERSYELLPGLTLRLSSDSPSILAYFDSEYGVPRAGQPNLVPSIEVYASESRFRPPADSLVLGTRHKTIGWTVAMWDMEEKPVKLAFRGKGSMATSFLQTFYLEPLLRSVAARA